MNENLLLEKRELREENLDRVEVLEKVKGLLLLPSTEFATMKMVAEYFGVSFKTIESCVNYNREELRENGCELYTRENLLTLNFKVKTKRGGFDILERIR